MASISEAELKKQIKSGSLSKVYFLFGDEKFLVKHYTESLVSSVLKNSDKTFNLQSFKGDEFDVDTFFSAVTAVPFLSEKKCVKLVDLDITKISESVLKKLKAVIEAVPQSTVLIISQVSTEINLKKSSKWSNFLKFINKYGDTCVFDYLTDLQISKVLISWAKKRDVLLSTNLAYLIVSYCGNDLLCLKNEVEKLCAFAKPNDEITKEMVDKIVVKDVTANIFALGRYIVNKDADHAFKELDVLISKKEEPTVILSILSLTYLDMYRVLVAKFSGESSDVVAKTFDDYKGKSFRISSAQSNCRRFTLDQVKSSLKLLLEADLKLKSSRIEKKVILDELIAKLLMVTKR